MLFYDVILYSCFCWEECELEHEIDCYGNGSKCVSTKSQCDGTTDCPNGRDESVELCGEPDEGTLLCC